MLILPIKKKWFDMIKSGEKKEEYREIKSYWTERIAKETDELEVTDPYYYNNEYYDICLKNGYSKNAPKLICKCELGIDTGKEKWGAESNKKYYVFKILNFKEIKK